MEIKSLGEPLVGQSSADQTGNLLRQLKASGSIEAVVLKLLPGQLLLGSRVGEILTSNTLNLQPGDRIRVRLDDSGAQAVLKVSREKDLPVVVQASANTRLKQALPEQQLKLALVLRVARQATEIQLAGERYNLPRRLPAVSRDLLTLLRDDSRDRIEIRVVDKKPVYKALLQQLLPRQRQDATRDSSLVRLVNLLREVVGEKPTAAASIARRAEMAAVKENPQQASSNSPAPSRTASTLNSADQPPASQRALLSAAGDPAGKPNFTPGTAAAGQTRAVTARPWVNLLAATVTNTTERPVAKLDAALARQNLPAGTPAARETTQVPPGSHTLRQKFTSRPTAGPVAVGPRPPVVNRGIDLQPQSSTGGAAPKAPLNRGLVPAQATASTPMNLANGQVSMPQSANSLQPASPGEPTPAALPRAVSAPTTTAPAPPGSPIPGKVGNESRAMQGSALAQLVRRLPDFAAIDRADIHRWLEINGLTQARPLQTSAAAAADLTRLLPQLADGEAFDRELEQLVQSRNRSVGNEDKPLRHHPVENLLASVREGLKLIEQSLAHSLLQRASIGLQQETQQPPSFNFALPVIDQQEVKPLWIDLHQRGKAASDEAQSWDVRLSFEFGDLGPISCHVFLQGFRIAASFYSDWASTRESIESALPHLRQQLVAAGFDPGEIHSFPGNMAPASGTAAEFAESLIDIEV